MGQAMLADTPRREMYSKATVHNSVQYVRASLLITLQVVVNWSQQASNYGRV